MIDRVFFQCSLPRAGSTLLQNILSQNPDFYATPTSGMLEVLLNARTTYTNNIEFKAQDRTVMDVGFKNFCNKGLFGFYESITDKRYVIDKSRGWSAMYDFVDWFYPNPKVVIMVRDLRCIVSSFEKKFREHQQIDSGLQNWNELKNTTVDKRVNWFLYTAPPLNVSLDVLYDTIMRKLNKKCLFVKFENFTMNPDLEMSRIYEYFELPYYKHDFENIEQKTIENDDYYIPFGDHKIQKRVTPLIDDSKNILGKHNCDAIYDRFDWFYKSFNYPK